MSDLYEEPANEAEELAIQDPDDLHRVRRVEAIHDARERFIRVRLQAREQVDADPMFHAYRKDKLAVLTALDYLRELEPMIRRSDSDILEREITIDGKRIDESQVPGSADLSDEKLRVEPVTVTTKELLDTAGELHTTHRVISWDSLRKERRKTNVPVVLTATERHALRIVRLCDDFIEDVLPSITSGDGEADFDYSDLL